MTCTRGGVVACIHLAGLGLEGAASAIGTLGGLPGLVYLNLESNRFSGAQPVPGLLACVDLR